MYTHTHTQGRNKNIPESICHYDSRCSHYCVPPSPSSISNELHSSRCVPKAISPVTMNLQCQRSRQQQTRDLHRRWGSAPDHSIGPWVVVHFVWQTNTDGWPCSTHDKMCSIHDCQRILHVCNSNWSSLRKRLPTLQSIYLVCKCSVCRIHFKLKVLKLYDFVHRCSRGWNSCG